MLFLVVVVVVVVVVAAAAATAVAVAAAAAAAAATTSCAWLVRTFTSIVGHPRRHARTCLKIKVHGIKTRNARYMAI